MATDGEQNDSDELDADGDGAFLGAGFRIGEYVIKNMIGHGSMSTVFLAADGTGYDVAVKVLQESPRVSNIMLERFRREVEACKTLRPHPNIITVFSTGEDGPNHYIAMQYVKGSRTFENLVNQQHLTTKEILVIVIKIARALQFAHDNHILHRDVKPSNIMINKLGEPLLADFGTAALTDLPSFTVTGSLTGTPLYMSPEQALGKPAEVQSDVYSLGVVLYEAVTGFLPYRTQHLAPVQQVLRAVQTQAARRPRSLNPKLSRDLESVLLKALEKDPSERYPSAAAFADDLENVVERRSVAAEPFSVGYFLRHVARRYRRTVAVISLLVLVAGVLWFYFSSQILEARYRGLIGEARLRNLEFLLAASDSQPSAAVRAAPAWNQIRIARREMGESDWNGALERLRRATGLVIRSGDRRILAIVELEQARCLTMQDRQDEALALYTSILQNRQAGTMTADHAYFEGIGLAMRAGDPRQVESFRQAWTVEPGSVLATAAGTLAGVIPPEQLVAEIETMSRRHQNDASFAIALRSLVDGDVKIAEDYLEDSIDRSQSGEWPAPYARKLLEEIER